jgi:hypothetical protein
MRFATYGRNMTAIEVPPLGVMIVNEALKPFFIFQVRVKPVVIIYIDYDATRTRMALIMMVVRVTASNMTTRARLSLSLPDAPLTPPFRWQASPSA